MFLKWVQLLKKKKKEERYMTICIFLCGLSTWTVGSQTWSINMHFWGGRSTCCESLFLLSVCGMCLEWSAGVGGFIRGVLLHSNIKTWLSKVLKKKIIYVLVPTKLSHIYLVNKYCRRIHTPWTPKLKVAWSKWRLQIENITAFSGEFLCNTPQH